jgi:hypothetical protein
MRKYLLPISFVVITVLLVLFIFHYHKSAFPELSPRFLLKKNDVPAKAHEFAQSLNLAPEAYQSVVSFNEDVYAKYFLELRYGLERLQQEINNGVHIWDWSVRYFLPGQEEEFRIHLNTEGQLVKFVHVIPEKTKRPKLSREKALLLARDFIARHVSGHPLEKLKLIETGEQEKTGHHIYNFTWERTDWQWGDGKYHLHVAIQGDRVGTFSEHLDVPEVWRREYSKKKSSNRIFQAFASAASTFLGLGFLVMFILLVVRHQINWRGFPYLWMIPVGLILLGAEFSQFPEILARYSTTDNIHSFLAKYVLRSVYSTFISLFGFLIIAFMADVFWQKGFPRHVPIRSLLNGRGLATKEVLHAVPLAFMLAALSLAYVIVYYIAGRKIGFWTPSSIDYAKVLTSYFPAIEALSVGISAAWVEEFMFRVLGLVFLYRLTGSKWLAIITTALVWGFLHSSYPQMPGYARGIELTLEGILLGWVATRFGILTTLLSHCLFNTWLGAVVAWKSGSDMQMIMAVLVSLWPAGLWLEGKLSAIKRGGYLLPSELTQGSPPLSTQLKEAEAIIEVKDVKITRAGWIWILVILAAVGLLSFYPSQKPLADLGMIKMTRSEAEQHADRYLSQYSGLDPSSYHRIAERYAYIAGNDKEYLLEHADVGTVARNMRQFLYQEFWVVKYFKAEERNTYTVYLNPDTSLFLLSRSIAETEEGAQLEKPDAIKTAEAFLQKHFGLQGDQLRYVSLDMHQQKVRRDYDVTFESTEWNIGESKLRWTVSLLGDEINSFSPYLKLPEDYLRKKEKQGWRDVVRELLADITSTAFLVGSLIIIIVLIVRHYIDWRVSFLFGLVVVSLDLSLLVNASPYFLSGYSTTQTMLNYLASKGAGLAVQFAVSYMKGVLFFAMLLGLVRLLTGWTGCSVLFPEGFPGTRQQWLHGVVLGIVGVALLGLLHHLTEAASLLVSSEGMLAWNSFAAGGLSPGLDSIIRSLQTSLTSSLTNGIFVMVLILLWKKHRNLLFVLLVLMVLEESLMDWQSGLEATQSLLFGALETALKLWIFIKIFRFNFPAYFFMFYYQALLPQAMIASQKAWPAYALDCAIIWCAVLLPLVIWFMVPRLVTVLGNGNNGSNGNGLQKG